MTSCVVLAGCEGGQTGQPTSVHCASEAVRADAHVDAVTPAELARAFEGGHTAPLKWESTSSGPSDAGALRAADEISIGIAYDGGGGEMNPCTSDLEVEIVVDVTTRDTGIHETGRTLFSAPRGSLEYGSFDLVGRHFRISATLRRSPGKIELSGTLSPIGDAQAGSRAEFSTGPTTPGSDGEAP
jgi:hypothetical protein